ncbi:MAG: HNH endonuclease family protein [Mediterranea sp.]|nr:HNH endonuclease family protein [Mediterranea sp.]
MLPQKWQTSFFPTVSKEEVDEKIEHIGNKTPFERKLNIVASNGYFKKKQEEYAKSKIEVTQSLIASIDSDWTLGHIDHREEVMSTEIIRILKQVDADYRVQIEIDETPTDEQLKMIESFKKKGWV